VLLFRKSPRDATDNTASRIAAPTGTREVVAQSLSERLREEGRPEFPIQFIADMNEFQLVYSYTNTDGSRVVSRSILHFDPFTGARLPESTRDSHFETPDAGDAATIMARLRGATTLADVKRILGEPDEVFPGTGDIKQQWTYSRLSKTVRVFVQETTSGKLQTSYAGQEKK